MYTLYIQYCTQALFTLFMVLKCILFNRITSGQHHYLYLCLSCICKVYSWRLVFRFLLLLMSLLLEGQIAQCTVMVKMLYLQHDFINFLQSNHIHQCPLNLFRVLLCCNQNNQHVLHQWHILLSGTRQDTLAFRLQKICCQMSPRSPRSFHLHLALSACDTIAQDAF